MCARQTGEEERLGKSIFTPALSSHQCSGQLSRNQTKTHWVEGLLPSTAENTETLSSRDVSPTSSSRSTPILTQTPEYLCWPGTIYHNQLPPVSGAYLLSFQPACVHQANLCAPRAWLSYIHMDPPVHNLISELVKCPPQFCKSPKSVSSNITSVLDVLSAKP